LEENRDNHNSHASGNSIFRQIWFRCIQLNELRSLLPYAYKILGFMGKMPHLKVLIEEKADFYLVGDDDSGPEDLGMIWILSAGACHPKAEKFINFSLHFYSNSFAFKYCSSN
jgi:hypothetical protein